MAASIELPGNSETIHLQQQVARLQALLEASRQVHSTIHEEEVLDRVLRIVVRELEMAGAAFPDAGLEYGDALAFSASEDANEVSVLRNACLRFPLEDREGRRMAELLVAPPEDRELTLYEADFIEGLALQAAVALENARNHKRNLEFARVQQDLDAARNIQRSLLPQKLPDIPGYSLAFRSATCYEVGGDYLDIVAQPDGSLLIAVADVAGKGLASAIWSAPLSGPWLLPECPSTNWRPVSVSITGPKAKKPAAATSPPSSCGSIPSWPKSRWSMPATTPASWSRSIQLLPSPSADSSRPRAPRSDCCPA
jgi:hypothetical protein